MKISKLAQNLIGSEIIKIGNQVNDLKAQGAEIANLTIGDLNSNIYPIPAELKEEIQKAYQNNLTNYPPANGLLSLRKSIAKDLKNRWNLDYSADEILVAGGSRPLIYATFKTIVDDGDKVVYPIPENEKPLYLMYDQIYAMLTFDEEHFNPVSLFPELKDYVIFVDGTSKCFAATGVRVGWSFGPREIIDKMKSLLTHVGAWAPKPEQEAVAVYLEQSENVDFFVNEFKNKIYDSLETLHEGIQDLKSRGFAVESIKPMGALYLTIELDYLGKSKPDGTHIKDSSDLVYYLIEEAGVALVPFSAFGNSRNMPWFRASAGGLSLEEIKKMLPRLEKALEKLK